MLVRTLEIAATAEAPTQARRWLDEITELRSHGQVAFDVRLLVTELVANSVRHAGLDASDHITVMLELSLSRVRVEVRDPGEGFAFPLREQARDSEGGRGLQIVAAISNRWGSSARARSPSGSRSISNVPPRPRSAPACRAPPCGGWFPNDPIRWA